MTPLRWLSAAVTVVALTWGLALGGGLPPSPATLAREAREAERNVRIAARNVAEAEADTRALTLIAENVARQVAGSRRMLRTQLEIERTSRAGAEHTISMRRRITSLRAAIRSLVRRLAALSATTAATGAQASDAAGAAGRLQDTLARLRARFDRLIEESRELNRKVHAFDELRERPR